METIATPLRTEMQELSTKTAAAPTSESDKSIRQPGNASSLALAEAFKGFDPHDLDARDMLSAAEGFCRAMASPVEPARWLVLLGGSGVGKTMLARMVTRFFTRRLDNLVDENRSTRAGDMYRRNGGLLDWGRCLERMLTGDFGFMGQACEDWFLALDDIGAESARQKDLSVSKLFTILNARIGKFTVITTNLTLEQVRDRLDTRIASRMLRDGSVVLEIKSPDYNAPRE